MSCKQCDLEQKIVNKHFQLCQACNNLRLHGSKFGKQYKFIQTNRKSLKLEKKPLYSLNRSKKSKSRKSLFVTNLILEDKKLDTLALDEQLYESAFNKSNHKCEECSKELPNIFRAESGRIIARYRYSHIIPKSIAPELRHEVDNINNLCLSCHSKWENGDKASMKIFPKNYKKFRSYLHRTKINT